MKKFFICCITFFCCITFLGFCLLFYMVCKTDEQTEILLDCVEFGLCKEGLETYIRGEEVTITKDYCIKNNYKWREDNLSCYCYIR